MSRSKGRAFWQRVIADVDAGMAQADAARKHGVSTSGVGYWMRRLHREPPRPAEPRLLPVRLTSASSALPCSLLVNELRFEFEEGTSPAYVAAIVQALRAC
jgi:transposase-like protein